MDAAAAADASDDETASCDEGGIVWADPGATPPAADPSATVHRFFAIAVVDQTNAPVVGATLTTTNATVYVTDRNGKVAYYEPGLMGTDVWFTPACSGYTYPSDGLGNAGTAIHPTEGGAGTITMNKTGPVTAPSVGDLQTRLLAGPVPGASQCMALRAVDSATMRGVPLVSFATSTGDTYWSDSQGMVAYCDPDEIGKTVVFTVTSDGYTLASGSTVTVQVAAGGTRNVPLVRQLPAQRLYRVTGQGIYRDSALLGLTMPTAHPNINGLVMGQDTPSTFVYGGQIYWIWQDTSRAAYPLGNFASSGAVSAPPSSGGLSADLGVDTSYFVGADGFSRGMVNSAGDPDKSASSGGPIWLGQIVDVVDAQLQPHTFGRYYVAASSNPWSALAEFDPTSSTFTYVADYPAGTTLPTGRPMVVGGYAYWSDPVRFPATVEGVENVTGYEVFSAFGANGSTTLNRNADGSLAYAWRPAAPVSTQAALEAAQVPADQDLDGHLTDIIDGGNVQVSNGAANSSFASTVMWNDYRKRFGGIIEQQYGVTFLGESWYSEADTPLGPWVFARKVVTHATTGNTFYNPDIIPFLGEAGGRIVFFDATYTKTYSKAQPTPRYDYNEMMYRLDLDDPEMALPVAVYDRNGELTTKAGIRVGDLPIAPAFFAYDRPVRGAFAVAPSGPSCASTSLVLGANPPTPARFYALPPDKVDGGPGPSTIPLYEYTGAGGGHTYSVQSSLAGYQRGAAIAQVWPTPIQVALPVADFLGSLVADAGPDQCVQGGSVTLDGSASTDSGTSPVIYTWVSAVTGCPLATGARATVGLPSGTNVVRLVASDAQGNRSTDEVVIQVSP
jgi:hypothetical protein